jgi:putative membrane protein
LNTAKTGVDETMVSTNEQLKQLDGLDDYAAEPVTTTSEAFDSVENYGTAFAPYFMSLSLWVGGLLIFFGIYLDIDKHVKSINRGSKNVGKRTVSITLIALAQGLALAFVCQVVLGIPINNELMYLLSCMLVSLTFVSMVGFFVICLGSGGKLLSLFVLVLQLASCAGTFPMETLPDAFKFFYPYMPMTYSVKLFKEAISGSANATAGKSALILGIVCIVFLVATIIWDTLRNKKSKDNESTPTDDLVEA